MSKDASELLVLLATSYGKLFCLAITTTFCKAAAISQQFTNCLTEIFFTKALAKAEELDETYAKTGKPTGPLFGLPISLKDQFQIKLTECNMEITSWIG